MRKVAVTVALLAGTSLAGVVQAQPSPPPAFSSTYGPMSSTYGPMNSIYGSRATAGSYPNNARGNLFREVPRANVGPHSRSVPSISDERDSPGGGDKPSR
jgi:hypothetical protein